MIGIEDRCCYNDYHDSGNSSLEDMMCFLSVVFGPGTNHIVQPGSFRMVCSWACATPAEFAVTAIAVWAAGAILAGAAAAFTTDAAAAGILFHNEPSLCVSYRITCPRQQGDSKSYRFCWHVIDIRKEILFEASGMIVGK